MGLEPMTSSLPRKCSTTELQQQTRLQAGEGNRTLVFSLEGCCTTIVLHPRLGTDRRNQPRHPRHRRGFRITSYVSNGGYRIRTCVGVANGFTVRPL